MLLRCQLDCRDLGPRRDDQNVLRPLRCCCLGGILWLPARRVKRICCKLQAMIQFGPGADLASQCPKAPAPDGWRAWVDADGPVPEQLAKRAQTLADDAALPLGTTESYPLPGVMTLIRIEPRAWRRDANGALIQGCFRVSDIYLPSTDSTLVAPQESKLSKAIGVLTVISLGAGIVATVVSLRGSR